MQKCFWIILPVLFIANLFSPIDAYALTWKEAAIGTAQDFRSIFKDGNQLIAAGNSGKVFTSDDSGMSWTSRANGSTTYYDSGKFKTGELIVIGQSGISLSSTDNGKTWVQYSFGTTNNLFHISTKGETGYLVGAGGYLKYYANRTWNSYTTNITEDLYASYDFGDDKTGYIGGTSGTIWKTVAGGTSWAILTTGTKETIRGLFFHDTNNGFAVGTKGTFLKTTNGGSSWSAVSVSGLSNQDLFAVEGNGDVITIVGDKIALVSSDAGVTWNARSFVTEDYTFYDVTNNGGSDIFAVGTKDGASSVVYQLVADPTPISDEITKPAPSVSTNPEPSSLIKLSCSANAPVNDPCKAVYFYATDGKRHAFPNDKVYFSWFTDFSTVKEVDVGFMSSLALGKNVTYRPGVKMVKFQSVPTVYAISKNGVLRAIVSEFVAVALYGSDWNKQIDDISDVFYKNYTMGDTIKTAADYDVISNKVLVGGISENF